MCQIPPELMGIPKEVLFRIPIAGPKDLLVMLSKKNADALIARAKARHISPSEFLVDLIKRELAH